MEFIIYSIYEIFVVSWNYYGFHKLIVVSWIYCSFLELIVVTWMYFCFQTYCYFHELIVVFINYGLIIIAFINSLKFHELIVALMNLLQLSWTLFFINFFGLHQLIKPFLDTRVNDSNVELRLGIGTYVLGPEQRYVGKVS